MCYPPLDVEPLYPLGSVSRGVFKGAGLLPSTHRGETVLRFSTASIGQDQDKALRALAQLIEKGQEHPRVRAVALKVVRDCEGRDDLCELRALYAAVKNGDPLVQELAKGFPYRADPKSIDFFVAPDRSLAMCGAGACGGDCDEHTTLMGALAGSLGFTVGARAYGAGRSGAYTHVYAVALVPKKADRESQGRIVGLDTTVPQAKVGWQPPPGHYRTAWVTED